MGSGEGSVGSRFLEEALGDACAQCFAAEAFLAVRSSALDEDGREGKTWYGSTNPRTCQLDHVFADAITAATVRSFRIDPYPVEAQGLSDYAPLLIDLDLEVAGPGRAPVEDSAPREAVPA